jgi:glycosyltransferase involved in cell wall biosynthesis
LGLGDEKVVAIIRGLAARMGHETLLEAWSGLVRRHAPVSMRLLVVGDGLLRADLERTAGRLGLGDSVRFLGSVESDSLTAVYRAADLSVVPSAALEGFGLAVLESLATGTPVMATWTGGLPDAFETLESVLLVAAGDPVSLAEGIERYLFADQRPRRDACRQHAERFSLSASAEAHVRLYRDAVDAPSDRTLRVVYLDHTAKLSGGELALARLLPALRPRVEALVLIAEDGPLRGRLEAAGVAVEILPLHPSARGLPRDRVRLGRVPVGVAWETLRYTIRLSVRLRTLQPDLVHTNSLKAMVYGLAAGKLARQGVIVHVRDRIAEDYLPKGVIPMLRFMCARVADGVVVDSDASLGTLGPIRCPTATIPSPVDSPGAPVTPRSSADRPFTVAIVGRIAPWKGQDLFLRAFGSAFPDGEEVALVVGSAMFGEDAFVAEIRTLVEVLGISDRVTFTGFLNEVADALSGVDVLVHTSILPEPFGQVVVEGMSAGICVIASGEGGPATVITDGVDGILCEPRSEASYASALRRVRSDDDLRLRLASNGQETSKRFAAEVVAGELISFYELVADINQRRRVIEPTGGLTR